MDELGPEVELLKEMVSIYSPTGQTEAISGFLLQKGREMGLETERDDDGNLIMTVGQGKRTVMFLCHMDTVPGELKVYLDGPILHGRGSVDAKGCLATAMTVASAFADVKDGRIVVVAVPDEEGPSKGVRKIIQGERPDLVIVGEPSGWQGITIGYKGSLRLIYRNTTDKFHTGAMQHNSAEMAVDLWGAIEAYCVRASEEAQGGGFFDVVSPTLISINTEDDGRTLCTEMEVDIRIPPGCDVDALLSFIDINRSGGEIEILGREPPVMREKNNELVRALIWAIRAHEGDPKFKKKTGTSDMNVAGEAWKDVPMVAYGPGDSSLDHTPEERIDIREYRLAIEVLKQAVGRIFDD